jgi:glycosyltransferase involved in cell wall biosynthesis
MCLCSVIVPVYNCKKEYLCRCLDSLLQCYQDFEIILVDNHSTNQCTDNMLEYSQKYSQIHYYLEMRQGVSYARNTGIAHSTGRWIVFCDADDEVMADKLCQAINTIEASDGDYLYSDYQKQKDYHCLDIQMKDAVNSRTIYQYTLTEPNTYGTVWGKVYDTRVLHQMDHWFDTSLSHAEDTEFLIRYVQQIQNPICFHQPFYRYYIYSDSIAKSNPSGIANMLRSLQTIGKDVNLKDADEERWYHACCNVNLLILLVNYVYPGKCAYTSGKEILSKLLDEDIFMASLKDIDKNVSMTQRVALWILQKKLYWLAWLMARVRNQ